MQSSAMNKIEYSDTVAYDLSRFDKRKRVREALEQEPVADARPIARPYERAQAAAKTAIHTGIPALTIVSLIAVAFLMFTVVLNYMNLYEVTMQISEKSAEYAALKSEEAILQVQSEQQLNVRRMEELASELGMSRPSNDQIIYLDLSAPDRGVILAENGNGTDFLSGIESIFVAAVDFFR